MHMFVLQKSQQLLHKNNYKEKFFVFLQPIGIM